MIQGDGNRACKKDTMLLTFWLKAARLLYKSHNLDSTGLSLAP